MTLLRALLLSVIGCLIAPLGMAQQKPQFTVAVFSKTAGWHHEPIDEAVPAIRALGKLHHFDVFWTEDPNRIFKDELLAKYSAVIFLLTTGDVLNDEQQATFERYIQRGGGFVGVHSASDTEYQWPWYTKMLGHMFKRHRRAAEVAAAVPERCTALTTLVNRVVARRRSLRIIPRDTASPVDVARSERRRPRCGF